VGVGAPVAADGGNSRRQRCQQPRQHCSSAAQMAVRVSLWRYNHPAHPGSRCAMLIGDGELLARSWPFLQRYWMQSTVGLTRSTKERHMGPLLSAVRAVPARHLCPAHVFVTLLHICNTHSTSHDTWQS